MGKPISVTVTADELLFRGASLKEFAINKSITPDWNIDSGVPMRRMLAAGIPVIGVDKIIGIARGELTITHEDGLDGDEWTYSFVGKPVREDARRGAHGQLQTIQLSTDLPMVEYAAELRADMAMEAELDAQRARAQQEEDEL